MYPKCSVPKKFYDGVQMIEEREHNNGLFNLIYNIGRFNDLAPFQGGDYTIEEMTGELSELLGEEYEEDRKAWVTLAREAAKMWDENDTWIEVEEDLKYHDMDFYDGDGQVFNLEKMRNGIKLLTSE